MIVEQVEQMEQLWKRTLMMEKERDSNKVKQEGTDRNSLSGNHTGVVLKSVSSYHLRWIKTDILVFVHWSQAARGGPVSNQQ